MSYNECFSGEVPNFDCEICPEYLQGGIRAFAALRETASFVDWTDVAEWQALIASGDLRRFPELGGEMPLASATTSQGYGNQSERTTGFARTITLRSPLRCNNAANLNALNRVSSGWKGIALLSDNTVLYINSSISFEAAQEVQRDFGTTPEWQVIVKWNDTNNPDVICNIPAGIFDCNQYPNP